ncbi:MAG: polyprenyl synthetase family protein [Aureispira sp.]
MKKIQQLFQSYQEANNFRALQPQTLYEPLDYILSLKGKQIRPILSLLACDVFGGNAPDALPVAMAVEIFHNFSLMHDDIMDASPLRRGQPSIHEKYGNNTAILSGDVMLIYAYEQLHKVDGQLFLQLFPVFNKVAIGVCEGQQMDVDFESQTTVALEEYIRMIELKTSVLLYGALKMGALVANASEEEAELIGDYGRNLGIAFQIKDDWLDTFGSKAKVGKRIGGDIVQNKKTALVIKALELADDATRAELTALLAQPTPVEEEDSKIEKVTKIFRALNIPEEMQNLMDLYSNKALDNLESLRLSNDKKQQLRDFLDMLMKREH